MSTTQAAFLGVDTGGTFTDFVFYDGRQVKFHKVLSTPESPDKAIVQGIRELGIDVDGLYLVHGSTVATNAILEGKGARTAFITNHGVGDMLTIGRQTRRDIYSLHPSAPAEPVPPELCLETGGRLSADGRLIEPLTERHLNQLHRQLTDLQPESVAINLLFSFLDPGPEIAIAKAIPRSMFVSRSSHIIPVYREYERGITTWLNAYVGPLVGRYVRRLSRKIPAAQISVMQSSGGTMAARQAAERAVHLLLSGPAGGLAGALFVAAGSGHRRLLSFDMGGTSTDVALIDNAIKLTDEGHIGLYPVAIPMVDMHTIGAGGGSIARVDAGGALQVGPQSAGAMPGPACYGQGGQWATVTDANLVLGRLRADAFLGGAMQLDIGRASRVLGPIARDLGTTVEAAAMGIVRLANEHMAQALRVISIQRGIDARDFTLVSFGGAGGLHVCALAESLGMHEAVVPVYGGVLSALGMLAARRSRTLVKTLSGELAAFPDRTLNKHYATLEKQGRLALEKEGVPDSAIEILREVDLRYRGQSYTLPLPWTDVAAASRAFHLAHEQRYGHALERPVELVNLRVGIQGPQPDLPLRHQAAASKTRRYPRSLARLYGIDGEVPVVPRPGLAAGDRLDGPVLITEVVSTTLIEPGWECRVADCGNLVLHRTR